MKKKIQFAAFPVMIISFVVGVLLLIFEKYFLSSSVHLYMQIIGDVVNFLAGTIISIAVLNFYMSISTERELIDSVQTKITDETDFTALNDEALKSILRNIAIAKLQVNKSRVNTSMELDMRALAYE